MIEYELTTISPLLMAGADQNKPEIRPTALKSLMRYWFRAIHGDAPTKDLWYSELTLFGGAGGSRQVKSRIKVGFRREALKKANTLMLPHKRQAPTDSIAAGERFVFRLGLNPGPPVLSPLRTPMELERVEALFFAALVLGGVGRRSRRAFGSLWVSKRNGVAVPPPAAEDLANWLNIVRPGGFQAIGDKVVPTWSGKQARFPAFLECYFGKSSDPDSLTQMAVEKSKNHISLGQARGGRFASPIIVSLIPRGHSARFVVTKLTSVPGGRKKNDINPQIQANYIKELI